VTLPGTYTERKRYIQYVRLGSRRNREERTAKRCTVLKRLKPPGMASWTEDAVVAKG